MGGYILKINGVSHRVTMVGGKKVYDPPVDSDPAADERFEEMLASQSPPRGMTDDVFMSGVGTLEKQVPNEIHRKKLVEAIRRNGGSISPFDWYNPGVAQKFGDPRAVLKHSEARGQIRKYCEELGVEPWDNSHIGAQVSEPEEDPSKPKHKLAPDIAARIMKNKIRENPELAKIDPRDLHAEVVDKHGHKE